MYICYCVFLYLYECCLRKSENRILLQIDYRLIDLFICYETRLSIYLPIIQKFQLETYELHKQPHFPSKWSNNDRRYSPHELRWKYYVYEQADFLQLFMECGSLVDILFPTFSNILCRNLEYFLFYYYYYCFVFKQEIIRFFINFDF